MDVAATLIEKRQTFFHCLMRRVGDRDIAEEVLQQFSLRAITRASDVKQRESVIPWLYRVLSSTLADFYRSEQSRRRGENEYARLQPTALHHIAMEPEAPCSCFHQLLPILTPSYAEVLQRIDLGGDSRAQVAKDLGITRNSLRVLLHRARQALQKSLLASCKGCEPGFTSCECTPSQCGQTGINVQFGPL
jgi:RNA polymerase sigma-70 factor (ECF subfamily)